MEAGILFKSPAKDVSAPGVVENEREYLNLDELKKLVKTECKYEFLKRAFLFSCLTGLRFSDIQKLVWADVQQLNDGWRLNFKQQKTKGLQYLDINQQAKTLIGEVGQPDERVFTNLRYNIYFNNQLQQWLKQAGISKQITFHNARHTFAVMQLTLGTEIYTLSKLLGHAELKTTQIYAKIIDEKKREAVNKIPDFNF